jgi:ParB family transcriptional regulator, chromosome partitioning protein
MAGLATVAVVIRELTAEQRLAVQLIENIDREALSILEESSAVVRLIEFGRKPKDVAGMLGKTQAWVSLRRKIAGHRRGHEYFVAEDRTRDAETLADMSACLAERLPALRKAILAAPPVLLLGVRHVLNDGVPPKLVRVPVREAP